MLQRDFAIAQMTPGRHMAGIFLKGSGEPVGVLDWWEKNPTDGKAWVGLLLVRADRQRQGIAAEAFAGLAELLRARGFEAVKAAVLGRNTAGRTLAERLGFRAISSTTMQRTSREEVVVLERALV